MRRLALLALTLAVPLGATHLHGGEDGPDAGLTRARARMVDAVQAYRDSLARLLAIQQRSADSAARIAETRRRLYEEGILSRSELLAAAATATEAREETAATRQRLTEAESVLGESLAALELARVASTSTIVVTPSAIASREDGDLTPAAVHDLARFFARRFARPLPVSARGQTPVHDRLGLDHRQAVDVAVHPDSEEGRAVIDYLHQHRLPFLAFRGVLPGASTGAHVHVGRASGRLVPATGRDPLNSGMAPALAR